jgi:hypothetical protein
VTDPTTSSIERHLVVLPAAAPLADAAVRVPPSSPPAHRLAPDLPSRPTRAGGRLPGSTSADPRGGGEAVVVVEITPNGAPDDRGVRKKI